jgi:hypothetical protein
MREVPKEEEMFVMAMFAADFGHYVQELMPGKTRFAFEAALLHSIGRMPEGGYVSTSCITGDGKRYAVSFDFDDPMFRRLYYLLPAVDQALVTKAFAAPVDDFVFLQFASPVLVDMETRLGEPTEGAFEVFVPFVVTRVGALGV